MEITRNFNADGSRYAYNLNQCSVGNGWAQFDTAEDAPYFGVWVNPAAHKIFTYCEGDETLQAASSAEEFAAEVRRQAEFYEFKGIDTGSRRQLAPAFEALGLGDLVHAD